MKADNIDTASSSLPQVELDFRECFNLDPETVLHQESIIFKYMLFPGKEEVPSYFTYRTTGVSSLTIPLLHLPLSQPFFRFRVGALVTNVKHGKNIKVKCEFKDRFGNSFHVGSDDFYVYLLFTKSQKGSQMLTILDCCIPLNEGNASLAQGNYYDHVDINIHITESLGSFGSTSELKEWGIRLLEEDSSSAENQLGNPNSTLPHVSEAEEGNMGYYTPVQGLVNEIEHNGESGDNNVETERSTKHADIEQMDSDDDIEEWGRHLEDCHQRRIDMVIQTLCSMFVKPMKTMMDAIRLITTKSEETVMNSDIGRETDHFEECEDSDISNESDQSEERGDSDDDGINNETDLFEECGNSD
jgi:hypothetical protein